VITGVDDFTKEFYERNYGYIF
jgi:EF-hand domain-containing protein 1